MSWPAGERATQLGVARAADGFGGAHSSSSSVLHHLDGPLLQAMTSGMRVEHKEPHPELVEG